jgi:hypothetical protein
MTGLITAADAVTEPADDETTARRWPIEPHARDRLLGWLAITIPLLVWAAALWPAVFVADSMDTWNQAAEGPVYNWHPPAYTYLQRLAYLSVHSPWAVTILQCLLMAWAIRRVLDVAIAAGTRRWPTYAFGMVIAALPPVGAFTSHLIKDVPFTIGFLLCLSVLARDAVRRAGLLAADEVPKPWRSEAMLGLGLALIAFSRVNGLIVLVGIALSALFLARRRLRALVAVVVVVAAFLGVTRLLYPALDIRPASDHLRASIFVSDLGAVFARDPDAVPDEAVDDLEMYASQEEWAAGVNCHWAGNPFQVQFYEPKPVSLADLREAWRSVLRSHTFLLVGNHLCAASSAWNPIPPDEELAYRQTVWDVVVPNQQGVVSDPLWGDLGTGARRLLDWVGYGTVSQILLWRAATWMYALALLLAVAMIRYRRWWALWLLVPFAAQAASVIAIAGPHYRYMAPAWIGAVLLLPTGWMLAVRRAPGRPDPSSAADGLAAGQVNGAGELGEVGGREGGIEVPERGEHVLDPVDPDAPASVQQIDEPAHRHLEPTEGP